MTAEPPGPWAAYRLRLKRRRLLWRSFRSRHKLSSVIDRTGGITPDDILVVMVVRNESDRLPWFMEYHRRLGAAHFLIVDNGSGDGTLALLRDEPDVSLWRTDASYRDARFGLDWQSWLLMKYGHGHWCLMLDADELLVYAHCGDRSLHDLTGWLDSRGRTVFGALMLDMYSREPVGNESVAPGSDPIRVLSWFDAGPYRAVRQAPLQNLWVQGGARERVFFADQPRRGPTLNKLPLVKWNRRWAFVNSCHSILPWELNLAYSGPGGDDPSGVLLHTKFLSDVVEKSDEDRRRRQHFHDPGLFDDYRERIAARPVMWSEQSQRYAGWRQLVDLGLMSAGGW